MPPQIEGIFGPVRPRRGTQITIEGAHGKLGWRTVRHGSFEPWGYEGLIRDQLGKIKRVCGHDHVSAARAMDCLIYPNDDLHPPDHPRTGA